MENEVWKDVVGYEGLYQVSNLGNVKSLPKEWSTANGGKRSHNGMILRPWTKRKGYKIVVFSKDGISKGKQIHQLVAESFLGHKPCGHKLVIDHINDDPSDNRLENLQIVTNRFNACKTQGKYKSIYKGVVIQQDKYKSASGEIKIYKIIKSSIYFNGEKVRLGTFKTEHEAHLAYQNALFKIENNTFDKNKHEHKPKYSSKYKGVTLMKTPNTKKWRARIYKNNTNKNLGVFLTEYEAHLAYQNAILKHEL